MSHTPPSFTPVLHAAFLSLSVPTNLNVESLGQSDFKNMLTVNSIEYVFRALDKPHADALWDVAGNPIGRTRFVLRPAEDRRPRNRLVKSRKRRMPGVRIV